MSVGLYKVVCDGKLVAGLSEDIVKQNIAKLFKQPNEKIWPLFSGKLITIKSDLTQAQAIQYIETLLQAGLAARMVPIDSISNNTPVVKQPSPKNANRSKPTIEEILKQFKGQVAPVRTSLGYRISITAAAMILLLIPLLYIALIMLTGYGVYYHATEDLSIIQGRRGGAWRLVIYLTPIIAGALLIIVMIKPLFANFGRQRDLVELDPNIQPHIFAFVRKICDAVKAPYPAVIRVDCEVNASASFRHGFASFFSNELVLTLGMPLLAGLNLRTLAGIIAHEFGHFSQGAAMRMTYVIYTVLNWLHFAVYREDPIDAQLIRFRNSEIGYLTVIAWGSHAVIWLVRRLLYVLMRFGEFIAQHMSRQMEFDADRYATRLIGSDRYQEIAINITRLSMASQKVNSQLGDAWHTNKVLVEDYPGAIAAEYANQDKEIEKEVMDFIEAGSTHWQDTHPSDRDRIHNAKLEKSPGIFSLDLPSHHLITRFDKLSKDITFKHYRNIWEIPVVNNQLIPVAQFVGKNKQRQESTDALKRYFNNSYLVYCPAALTLSNSGDERMLPKYIEQWQLITKQINDQSSGIKQFNDQYDKLFEKLVLANRADALIKAGFTINPRDFNVPSATPNAVENWLATSQTQYNQCLQKLLDYNKLIMQRLQISLNIGYCRGLQDQLNLQELELADLPRALQYLQRVSPVIEESRTLNFVLTRLTILLANWDDKGENSKELLTAIEQHADLCKRHLQGMKNRLDNCPYPLKHAKSDMQLTEHLIGRHSIADFNPPQLANFTPRFIDDLYYLQWQVMANLARMAVQSESVAGLADKQ